MGTPDSPTKLDRRFCCSFLPNAESRRYEQRWRIIGMVGARVVMVVHTWPDLDSETGEEIWLIISTRKGTRREREAYKEGHY